MTIKLIAVDMDGTFLNDNMEYDRERFAQQYVRLKRQGIKFVVASGNQYYQLRSFFPQIADEIAFVAENGAYIVNQNQPVFCAGMSREHYQRVMAVLASIPSLEIIVCCKNSAYLLACAAEAFFSNMKRYYHRLRRVTAFSEVEEMAFKFALTLPNEQLPCVMRDLSRQLEGIVCPVSSGHGSIDLIIPGVHKANGLKILQNLWGIADQDVAAFGDGGNDREMLRQAGFGYAMGNAPETIKAEARFMTSSNNESGVLTIIDDIIASSAPHALYNPVIN